jgi:hypothetical protein
VITLCLQGCVIAQWLHCAIAQYIVSFLRTGLNVEEEEEEEEEEEQQQQSDH